MKVISQNKSTIIGTVIFAVLAFLVIGISCYRADTEPVGVVASSPRISAQKFSRLYNHKDVKNLTLMPNRKNVNVSGNYRLNNKDYGFKAVVNENQL